MINTLNNKLNLSSHHHHHLPPLLLLPGSLLLLPHPLPPPPSPYPKDKWKCSRLQWVCVLLGSGIVRRARRKCSTPTVRSVGGRLARRKGKSLSPVTSVLPSITSTVISPLCGASPGRLCAMHPGLFSFAGHVTKKWMRKTCVTSQLADTKTYVVCHKKHTHAGMHMHTQTQRTTCTCTHKHTHACSGQEKCERK